MRQFDNIDQLQYAVIGIQYQVGCNTDELR